MYKLEFTLKQHTPIIHFQHNEDGATLRASEVKPKLDRFLIEKLQLTEIIIENGKNKIVPKKEFESWFNNKEKLSLDYKLKFLFKGNIKKYLPLSSYIPNGIKNEIKNNHSDINEVLTDTGFFGNEPNLKLGKRENTKFYDKEKSNLKEAKLAIFSNDLVFGNISSQNSKLKECVRDYLQEFFLLHNFGTRQTKGFGSYTIKSISDFNLQTDKNLLSSNNVRFEIESNTFQEALKLISRTHKILKSGININWGYNREYEKSELFYYFSEYDIRWDKRFIKKEIEKNKIDRRKLYRQKAPTDFYVKKDGRISYSNVDDDFKENESPYKFIRALLGLAEHYEFLIDNNGLPDNRNKYIVEVEHIPNQDKEEKIERFNSPILYKVIDNNIYVIPKEIPSYLFDSKFKFKYKLKEINNTIEETSAIPVPNKSEFDLVEFLNDAFKNKIFNAKKITL